MSKKPSLAAALQTYDRSAPSAPTMRPHRATESTAASQAPSRQGKKALIGYFDPVVSKQLKQIALDLDTTSQELMREALNDFFQKHGKPAIA